MAKGDGGSTSGETRLTIAIVILALSVGGIVLASVLAIVLATATDRADTTLLVFTAVLPLFGTWVGTVLAFYFAGENLQAATESTLRLTGRPEPRTPVQQVMIPKARIASWDLKPGEVAGEISLHGLYKRMQSTKVHRIPILNESGAVLYVVHDSTIAGFAGAADPSDDSFEKTMAELLGHPEFGKFIEAIAFVGPDAVLADARAAMRSVERCNDVFVTTSGQKADPILGWLTNTDLAGLE